MKHIFPVCTLLFAFIASLVSVDVVQCSDPSFQGICRSGLNEVDVAEARKEDNCSFYSELDRFNKAIHYETEKLDLWINESGGVFNGQRFTWKEEKDIIAVFSNSLRSTDGEYEDNRRSYDGQRRAGVYVTRKDNIISLASVTQKAVVSFHPDRVEINERSRSWFLIIPCGVLEKSSGFPLDSKGALEQDLLAILSEIVEEDEVASRMVYFAAEAMKADDTLWKTQDGEILAFRHALKKLDEMRSLLHDNGRRDDLTLAFYKGQNSELSFSQVKELRKRVSNASKRDYMIHHWTKSSGLDCSELIEAAKLISDYGYRDSLLIEYARDNAPTLSKEELEELRRACAQNESRDEIALMIY